MELTYTLLDPYGSHCGRSMAQPIFHRTNGPYHGVLGTHEAQGDASHAHSKSTIDVRRSYFEQLYGKF
jgi:hypothetical protein